MMAERTKGQVCIASRGKVKKLYKEIAKLLAMVPVGFQV